MHSPAPLLRIEIPPLCRSMIFFEKAKPSPVCRFLPRREERAKNLMDVFRSDAVTVVGDHDEEIEALLGNSARGEEDTGVV